MTSSEPSEGLVIMALERGLGLVPGEVWVGNSVGGHTTVKIVGLDLRTGEVHYEYVPQDTRYPFGKSEATTFLRNYSPERR